MYKGMACCKRILRKGRADHLSIYLSIYLSIKPPQEANFNKFWKLKKVIYGLCDASRVWYV